MSVNEFDKKFGLKSSIDKEKSKFINRIENSLFNVFIENFDFVDYENLFIKVCYELGEDASEIISQNSFINRSIPNFKIISNKDFIQTLRVVVAIYKCSKNSNKDAISRYVENAIKLANINIGIKWIDGIFYPTGDILLDDELIDVSVSLLDKYPNEKKDLKTALENYHAKSLYGVVENCYICVEGLSRQLLNNKKTLDNNKENLLSLLRFSQYWDKIFLNYLKFAHEYRRHAGEKRHELNLEEIEGYLYMTCLIVRSMIRAFDERTKK